MFPTTAGQVKHHAERKALDSCLSSYSVHSITLQPYVQVVALAFLNFAHVLACLFRTILSKLFFNILDSIV